MRSRNDQRLLVTGGCGFIGCSFVRALLTEWDATVINVDKLTYAASVQSLEEARLNSRHVFERVDVCDKREIERIFHQHKPTSVVHLAAESHVDRSIESPTAFMETNVVGTSVLLDVAARYWSTLEDDARQNFRFHHVSTDEVYGDLDPDSPPFTELTRYAPSSPYSASKAASDHLVRAWHRTYDLPVVITNCSNNYGPYQFPEKLIPLMILNAIEGKPLPVYGDGSNIRDWLYVDDHVRALQVVLTSGRIGETYNIGGGAERTNLEVVQQICSQLDALIPDPAGRRERLIQFVADRPGHDRRYAINCGKITKECGWTPKETFQSGLKKTVQWYLEHQEWVDQIRTGKYLEWIDRNYSNRQLAR